MTPHRGLVRNLVVASVLALVGLSEAVAQFPPPPGQSGSPLPPPPGQQTNTPFPPPPGQSSPQAAAPPASAQPRGASPFPMPGQSPAPGANPCEGFVPLRQDAEKNATAIRVAS